MLLGDISIAFELAGEISELLDAREEFAGDVMLLKLRPSLLASLRPTSIQASSTGSLVKTSMSGNLSMLYFS